MHVINGILLDRVAFDTLNQTYQYNSGSRQPEDSGLKRSMHFLPQIPPSLRTKVNWVLSLDKA